MSVQFDASAILFSLCKHLVQIPGSLLVLCLESNIFLFEILQVGVGVKLIDQGIVITKLALHIP